MTIEAYLHAMQERFVTDPIVTSFHVIRARSTLVDGHLRAQLALADGSKRHNYADGTRETTEVRPLVEGIVLDPDVQAYFPDAEAVNTALRGLNFDTQGRFLGTLGDENGAWEPRESSCPDTAVDVDEE